MIDCHLHTKRSNHGEGDLEDFVVKATKDGFKIIGFSEHAPFIFDEGHRMDEEGTQKYLRDIVKLKRRYGRKIKILAGLEVDYLRRADAWIRETVSRFNCDFLMGGVHFLEVDGEKSTLWDYEKLQEQRFQEAYFQELEAAASSGIFNGMVHPDLILRSGLDKRTTIPRFKRFLNLLNSNGVAYEVNCSGISKNSYNPARKVIVEGAQSYPNLNLAIMADDMGIPLTIGSDAHSPENMGRDVTYVIGQLKKRGVKQVCYFEKRRQKSLRISDG